MATVNQEFQSAPMGRRVVAQVFFGLGAVCVAFTIGIAAAFHGHVRHASRLDWAFAFIGPVLAVVLALPAFLTERSRVARFRIENNVLILGKQSYPLEGLVAVDRDPEVLRHARRTIAGEFPAFRAFGLGKTNRSGKLSSIQGTFKSKRLGKFYAFLTGTENAVVLRWPDKAVAVSPADTEFFIYMVRSGAGLR